MFVRVLHGLALCRIRIVVVEHAEICAGLRPNVIRLRRVNMRVIPTLRGQGVVVLGCIRDLLADLNLFSVYGRGRCAIDQTVQEGHSGSCKSAGF